MTPDAWKAKWGGVTLVLVTKTFPYAVILEWYRKGQRDFGENYADELIEKAEAARADGLRDIRWHFVGRLQSNKIAKIARFADVFHSLDSPEHAGRLDAAGAKLGKDFGIFIQVNPDGEESKGGLSPERVNALVTVVLELKHLKLLGLMALPRPGAPPAVYEQVVSLARQLPESCPRNVSLGTSDDYELAISQGATHVRLGRALLGERR